MLTCWQVVLIERVAGDEANGSFDGKTAQLIRDKALDRPVRTGIASRILLDRPLSIPHEAGLPPPSNSPRPEQCALNNDVLTFPLNSTLRTNGAKP